MFFVEHEPYTYFLLRDGDDLYLDANCDHGAVGYSVLIQMNDEEVKHYVENGKAYVRDLAVSIHNNVPILRPGSKYDVRDIAYYSTTGKRVMNAIKSWQKQSIGGSESN